MDNRYNGVIWTNHALKRLSERRIKQGDAWATFSRPQHSRYASSKNAWVFWRDYQNQRIEVVATQDEKKQWVILSVWSRENNFVPKARSLIKILAKFFQLHV